MLWILDDNQRTQLFQWLINTYDLRTAIRIFVHINAMLPPSPNDKPDCESPGKSTIW